MASEMSVSPPSLARMSRDREELRCGKCGAPAPRWVGRCQACGAWDSLFPLAAATPAATAVPIASVDCASAGFIASGQDELDRVLGGGLVPGAVTLLAGEPGVGKSTLALDVAARVAARGLRVLVVTAEESAPAVRLRAERIGALDPQLWLAAQTDLTEVEALVTECAPRLLVIDSVQTLGDPTSGAAAGGVGQVREAARRVGELARSRGIAALMIGHVTKEGSVAGPRSLEHMVDAVLTFEGETGSHLRLLRATKNRFGGTEELGCFELHRGGIRGVPDPGQRFMTLREQPVPGTCVTVALDGRRALPVEVQALVGGRSEGSVRRVSSGLDASRLAVLLAVIERRGGLSLAGRDVYTATVGGARLIEPAADLAVALAVVGSTTQRCLGERTVAVGEVGLTGELRPVPGLARRLAEAARLGFTKAIVPASGEPAEAALELHRCGELGDALRQLRPRARPFAVLAG